MELTINVNVSKLNAFTISATIDDVSTTSYVLLTIISDKYGAGGAVIILWWISPATSRFWCIKFGLSSVQLCLDTTISNAYVTKQLIPEWRSIIPLKQLVELRLLLITIANFIILKWKHLLIIGNELEIKSISSKSTSVCSRCITIAISHTTSLIFLSTRDENYPNRIKIFNWW